MNLINATYVMVLAAVPLLYWTLPRRWRLTGLSLMSVAVLAWFSWPSAVALMAVTAVTYTAHVRRAPGAGRALAVIMSLLLVFVAYKTLPLLSLRTPTMPLLLIGLAFYLLKALRILLDHYRNPAEQPVAADLFCAYMLFLPTLLIGPIHGLRQFQADWRQQAYSGRRTSLALERLLWGYAKIVLLGSYLVNLKFAVAIEGLEGEWPRLYEYAADLRYGLHLYFTFAGASDVAIAFASMLGFRIDENFNHPFAASSIAEFWRRWHMSLSGWARHYVYGPLAAITRHHAGSLILTMALIGLWHEFSARYLIWGAYHGVGLVVHHRWVSFADRSTAWRAARQHYVYRALAICITFHFVMLGFGIARADTPAEMLAQLQRLVWGAS